MKIKKLIKGIEGAVLHGPKECEVTGVCTHSKATAPGNLFIARSGETFDGSQYVGEAIGAGAVAVLTDIFDPTLQVTQVVHPNPASLEALLADRFYGSPSKELMVVGITGTNGKTTTAYMIKHLLDKVGVPCGLIGTVEHIVGTHHYSASHTTPNAALIQKFLREMVKEGSRAAVMEVSSHALQQGRADKTSFDVGIFTNLSQEHLDYHKTWDAYRGAKAKLFQMLDKNALAVLNADCTASNQMAQVTEANIATFGIEADANYIASDIELSLGGTYCTISEAGGEQARFSIPYIGTFNVYNLLAACAVGRHCDISLKQMADCFEALKTVPGRMEPVANEHGVHVFVDFAHTPDGLESVLKTLKPLVTGKLIVVFGCGGDRDQEKRPMMGRVAGEYADSVIVTSDNPRSEDPYSICEAIVSGMEVPALIEVDRRKSIEAALEMAQPGDIVLIAGKGHEKDQQFQNTRVAFSDVAVAEELGVS